MTAQTNTSANHPCRVGILLSNNEELRVPALRYLLLKLNSLQSVFEYEFLPNEMPESPLDILDEQYKMLDRKIVKEKLAPAFLPLYIRWLQEQLHGYGIKEARPSNYLIISLARLKDGYYSTRPSFALTVPNNISILALGNWQTQMAPPSIVEFILTLTLRESIAFISPSLAGSIHLGTKGCICDFTASLEEAKFKALHGFVCQHCRMALTSDGYPNLGDDIQKILNKSWLGKRSDPGSVAGILAHLRYDLFITKGLTSSKWELFLETLQTKG